MSAATASAILTVRPGRRAEDANLAQRIDWLERSMDTLFREIDGNQKREADDLRALRQQLAEMERALAAAKDDLGARLAESQVPGRWEWWGSGLIGLGLFSPSLTGWSPRH